MAEAPTPEQMATVEEFIDALRRQLALVEAERDSWREALEAMRAMAEAPAQDPMIAMLQAASRVREGAWMDGAPSHLLADLLTELRKDGWVLRYEPRQLEAFWKR